MVTWEEKMEKMGITGLKRMKAINNNMEAAEKASSWLWLKRGDQWGQ